MNTTSLLYGARALLLGAGCAMAAQAYAIDAYDDAHLTVPMVDVNGTVYTNIVTSVGAIVSVEPGPQRGTFDSYNTSTGLLFIPAVTYQGATYNNVTVSVSIPNLVHVGGTMLTAPSFVVVANSNDQTIRSYPYGVNTASQTVVPAGSVRDAALANLLANKQPKLFLDKANGLLFDAVRLASGGFAVTTFAMNLATGSITAIGGASVTLPGGEGTVDTVNHRIIAVGNSGATIYPYDPATGLVQPASGSSNDPAIQNVMSYDPQDGLLFGSSGTQLSTYSFAPGSADLVPVTQMPSSLDNSNVAFDVTGRFDLARKIMFVSDTPTASSGTTLTAVPFSASTVGPAGNTVATTNSWFCGVDPTARLLLMAPTNGSPGLNIFSYGANGAINASPTPFSPSFSGGNWGGCSDIDPANRIVFFSSNGDAAAVSFYVYDTTSGILNIATTQAGRIALTPGPGQIDVLSTQSLGVR